MRGRLQAVKDARAIFWKHLRKIPFSVCVPADSDFVHVGTTVGVGSARDAQFENIEFLTRESKWSRRLSLRPHVQS